MPTTKDKITSLLLEEFTPFTLKVLDNSAAHNEHLESDFDLTHLALYIVSPSFENMPIVARQRLVNKVLQPFFDLGLHAVQMQTKAPSEING